MWDGHHERDGIGGLGPARSVSLLMAGSGVKSQDSSDPPGGWIDPPPPRNFKPYANSDIITIVTLEVDCHSNQPALLPNNVFLQFRYMFLQVTYKYSLIHHKFHGL